MHPIEVLEKNESKKLYQWDIERYVSITAPKGVEVDAVDFAHEKEPQAIRKKIVNEDGALKAKIPNTLLQSDKKIRAWLMCGEQTVSGRNLVVLPKAKSPDYILPDDEDEVRSYIGLEKRIEDLEKNEGCAGATDAVQYVEQELTEEQQEQARKNIGAASIEEVNKISRNTVVYNVKNYGISGGKEDNTKALQDLVDLVYQNGGGTIYFPIGTYSFEPSDTVAENGRRYAVMMKSNVSIIGENLRDTVFKQIGDTPFVMFYFIGTPDEPITGCKYENFAVDGYENGNTNAVYGKAFHFKYVRDCVFRDLLLRGTVATALGIDFLDRVLIENVNCYSCGRTFTGSEPGSSGIGIGTGGWEHENFIINNCVCKTCGQYGIFIENQYNLNWGGNTEKSKGCIISNCVTRNGKNKGIGIRGGQNVTVIGCESYENTADGIFVDGACKNVKIVSCASADNKGTGINIATTLESEKVVVKGNMVANNASDGILLKSTAPLTDMVVAENTVFDNVDVGADIDGLVLMDNYVKGSLIVGEYNFNDATIKNNVFGGVENKGTYTGNTSNNDLLAPAEFKTVIISNEDFAKDWKLDKQGAETESELSGVSDFLDVSAAEKIIIRYSALNIAIGAAVVEYDENKNFVKRTIQYDVAQAEPEKTNYEVPIVLESTSHYIRISINELNDTFCVVSDGSTDGYSKEEIDELLQNLPSGSDLDVQINGTSIVENGIANIPLAGYQSDGSIARQGLVNIETGYGFSFAYNTNRLILTNPNPTSTGEGLLEKRKTDWKSSYHAILCSNLDHAVKLAMCDGKGAEWTAEEKASAKDRFGLGWRYIDTIEVADVGQIEITFPQEYDEFMIMGDVEGTGSSAVYPICAYFGETGNLLDRTVLFSDFYPSDKKEHFELTFEKATFENEVLFRMSGFEKTDFNPTKLKQNSMTTGWFDMYDTANRIPCHGWWGVRINRTITSASFKLYAR